MHTVIQKIRARKVPILIFLVGLFFGMILGILLSPAKKGFTINSNNNNSYAAGEKKKSEELHEDLAMEMGELR